MNSFKQSLDRYLTTGPQDDYTPYCEEVYDNITEKVFDEMEETNFVDRNLENAILESCFNRGVGTKLAAKILTDIFNSYFKSNK